MWTTPGFWSLVEMYYHFDGNIAHKGGGVTIPPTLHYDSKMATPRFRPRGRLGLAVKRALASKDVKYICRSSILTFLGLAYFFTPQLPAKVTLGPNS